MSVAHELVGEHLPVAMMGGINPAYALGLGALAASGVSIKKITPHLHHTINDGEHGVLLHRGSAVPNKKVTEEDIAAGKSQYKVLGPGWYPMLPFRSIETVWTSHQTNHIHFGMESIDDEQLAINANITWMVSPDGDSPVHSVTRVKHQKEDKKDTSESSVPNERMRELEIRVLSICSFNLGQVLGGRPSYDLKRLHIPGHQAVSETEEVKSHEAKNSPELIQAETIKSCANDLLYYGVLLEKVELMPIIRTGEEVLRQGLVEARDPAPGLVTVRRTAPASDGTGKLFLVPDEPA